MRQISGLVLAPIACLALLVSSPATADAAHQGARPSPWSAYFPAKGVTCAQRIDRNSITKGTARTTVKVKSPRKVVTYTRGVGRSTYLLLPGGRLRTASSYSSSRSGYHTRGSLVMTLPSPGALARHGAGRQTYTITMTVPSRVARVLLQHGRTFRMNASYRAAGLGADTVRLADTDRTTVHAVGYRVALGSIALSNIKPAYRNQLKRELRPSFAELQYADWTAKRMGDVLIRHRDSRGNLWTATTAACGRNTKLARTAATLTAGLPELGHHIAHGIDASSVTRALPTGSRS